MLLSRKAKIIKAGTSGDTLVPISLQPAIRMMPHQNEDGKISFHGKYR